MRDGRISTIGHQCFHKDTSWSIHKTLMETECEGIQWEEGLIYDYYVGPEHDPEVFDLFVQWLYTQEYREEQGLVQGFDFKDLQIVTLPHRGLGPENPLDWGIKAAIACWELGASLRAKNFQNYAIKRLLEAFGRPLSQPLASTLFTHTVSFRKEHLSGAISKPQQMIQDIIVRNWGDDRIIDHSPTQGWSQTIGSCHDFRDAFFEVTRQTLAKRREKGLSLADSLIH
ncbi:hypothetical protein J4E90_010958 [Alternaria incomplexa]|uniref:uncharacterized protein n=1 Tax=Alternaria incomplexa TaxID=1187928 RepID=UPI00221F44D6|nr:uncharacterized protein J4E90_010958 [Alternaria incomplexa]KAI4906043.1 hypothetical protein J4E90_010958 [Alternaria incomplexa]